MQINPLLNTDRLAVFYSWVCNWRAIAAQLQTGKLKFLAVRTYSVSQVYEVQLETRPNPVSLRGFIDSLVYFINLQSAV